MTLIVFYHYFFILFCTNKLINEILYGTCVAFIPEWLNPELYDRDTTGVNRYLRICEKLEIQPITYFVKHMLDKELFMKYHGIGPLGVKAMSDPLEVSKTYQFILSHSHTSRIYVTDTR